MSYLDQLCVFRADRKTKMAALANPSTKGVHYTRVHNMWLFWPLVIIFNEGLELIQMSLGPVV